MGGKKTLKKMSHDNKGNVIFVLSEKKKKTEQRQLLLSKLFAEILLMIHFECSAFKTIIGS